MEVNLEAERDRLAGIFQRYYPSPEDHPDWYHNFDHPMEVSMDTIDNIAYCEQNGVVFSRDEKLTLLCESFIHDLDNLLPLDAVSPYTSVEDRSRHIGPPILIHFGYDREKVALPAGEVTMATELGSVCLVDSKRLTLLRKIARRTDMGNVAKPYEFFKTKVEANWHEFKDCKPDQANISLKDFWFKKARQVVIDLVHNEDLAYGDWDYEENGVCGFQNSCAVNIDRYDEELLAA